MPDVHTSRHLKLAYTAPDARHGDELPVRVVLAEDHPMMRRSLRALLDGEPDIEVLGEARELATAIAQVRRYHPAVLVLDLRMSSGTDIDAVRRMRVRVPETMVVVITMNEAHGFARKAHDAGAVGFVLKDMADVELPEAIRRAANGEPYTSPRVRSRAAPLA